MKDVLSCTLKNSELNVPKEKRMFLVYPSAGLCPCTLEECEDGVVLSFSAEGMAPAAKVQEKARAEILRFLILDREITRLQNERTLED